MTPRGPRASAAEAEKCSWQIEFEFYSRRLKKQRRAGKFPPGAAAYLAPMWATAGSLRAVSHRQE